MSEQEMMDRRLWDFIDGIADSDEIARIQSLIQVNEAWQQRYEELREIGLQLKQVSLAQPSMRFSKNVMEQIYLLPAVLPLRTRINKWVFRCITGTFLLFIAGLLLYSFTSVSWHNSNTIATRVRSFWPANLPLPAMIAANVLLLLIMADKILTVRRLNRAK